MTEQGSKKQAVVVQGNELIVETSNSMKMNQLKILYFLMSCIEREDELFFPIEVDYKTLLAIINYDSNKGGKKAYLTDLLEDMAQKSYYCLLYTSFAIRTRIFTGQKRGTPGLLNISKNRCVEAPKDVYKIQTRLRAPAGIERRGINRQ